MAKTQVTVVKKGSQPKKPAYRAEDLVYLVFADNRCYTKVTKKKPQSVSVDVVNGSWSWENNQHAIGESDFSARYNASPIIGVYDRTNDKQLSQMADDACEARKPNRD